MQSFGTKAPSVKRAYTVAFSDDMASGAVIASAAVSIAVYENSPIPDPAPQNMLNGDPQINSAAVTIGRRTVPVGQAISQPLKGGVEGCIYVVTFTATISSSQVLVEQVILRVAAQVPEDELT